jgi:hypothetical protein
MPRAVMRFEAAAYLGLPLSFLLNLLEFAQGPGLSEAVTEWGFAAFVALLDEVRPAHPHAVVCAPSAVLCRQAS